MKTIVGILFLVFSVTIARAQHHHGHHALPPDDTTHVGLGYSLDKGQFEFHARSFFMGTINKGDLLDYSTLGIGAGLGYYSPSWKGFHLGFSGFFVFQLYQDNIYKEDPTTGNTNRYEVLLYDMHDFENTRDLDRLEELYLTYENKGITAVVGRQKFESPLLNEQDNRMRPNIYNGLSVAYEIKKWQLTAAWFNQLTIRGTVDWYSAQNSFGVYPFGRNPFGTASNYQGNIKSLGIGAFGVKHQNDNWKTQAWNYVSENVFNLAFAQSEYELKRKKMSHLFGVQGFYQNPLNNGGNIDQHKTYILKDEFTYGVGARYGIKIGGHELTANYLGISNTGRFLFPREWGREQFFASLPRERYEGAGALNAYTLKYKYTFPKKNFYAELGLNYTDHTALQDVRMNKYGIPSYYHFTGTLDYKFQGFFEGLDIKLLVAQKTAANPSQVPDKFRINRVDLWNFNLIIDYRF